MQKETTYLMNSQSLRPLRTVSLCMITLGVILLVPSILFQMSGLAGTAIALIFMGVLMLWGGSLATRSMQKGKISLTENGITITDQANSKTVNYSDITDLKLKKIAIPVPQVEILFLMAWLRKFSKKGRYAGNFLYVSLCNNGEVLMDIQIGGWWQNEKELLINLQLLASKYKITVEPELQELLSSRN